MHPLLAERLDGQGGRERRVDSARDSDYHLPEAVLVHVAAQAELEREPHLLQLVEPRRDAGLERRSPSRRGARHLHELRLGQSLTLARQRAWPHVA